MADFVRTAVLKRTFAKGNKKKWSYKVYENTQIVNDTTPSDQNRPTSRKIKGGITEKDRIHIEGER